MTMIDTATMTDPATDPAAPPTPDLAARPPDQFREPARVARGAEFLDGHFPGWTRRIRLARLRIGSCFDCVLGQMFGAYDEAKTRVIGPMLPGGTDVEEWVYEHGFVGGTASLKAAWVREITGRRQRK